jgi:hypothetical protein
MLMIERTGKIIKNMVGRIIKSGRFESSKNDENH